MAILAYTAELVGIQVIIREEACRSKCSFLDLETIEKRDGYASRRGQRGLFISATGRRIRTDLNASNNLIRKEASCALAPQILREVTAADAQLAEGAVVRPVRFDPTNPKLVSWVSVINDQTFGNYNFQLKN